MKKTTILSGKHTAAGNFTGYNALGQRIHISMAQMVALDMADDKKLKLPLFAITGEREFDTMDEDGKPTGQKFTREQALSVYKTADELIVAVNSDAILDINAAKALSEVASTSGLTEAQVNKLVEASI